MPTAPGYAESQIQLQFLSTSHWLAGQDSDINDGGDGGGGHGDDGGIHWLVGLQC